MTFKMFAIIAVTSNSGTVYIAFANANEVETVQLV